MWPSSHQMVRDDQSCTLSESHMWSDDDLMLGLHYVPGSHGNHVLGHHGQNGMDVRQRRGTGWANVTGRDCRGCRGKFFNCQKICHGSHGADYKPSRPYLNGVNAVNRDSTWQYVIGRNKTWRLSVVGREHKFFLILGIHDSVPSKSWDKMIARAWEAFFLYRGHKRARKLSRRPRFILGRT